jgi:hypothetical protein
LLSQLDFAVKAAWTSRHQPKYVDVKVLLMSWESDDLGVQVEIDILESVFREVYRYHVKAWKIPDILPGRQANFEVKTFVDQGGNSDNLLIVYYAGHAMPNPEHSGLPIWFAK